jgi:hypothetical protein
MGNLISISVSLFSPATLINWFGLGVKGQSLSVADSFHARQNHEHHAQKEPAKGIDKWADLEIMNHRE